MQPMTLPYVDSAPSTRSMMAARSLVRREADRLLSAGGDATGRSYLEKMETLRSRQLADAREYATISDAMRSLRPTFAMWGAGSDGAAVSHRKRPRDSDSCPNSDAHRFEAKVSELLSVELKLWALDRDPRIGDHSQRYATMLHALQNTQVLLKRARQDTEEINALRFLEQQHFLKVQSEKMRLIEVRSRSVQALESILQRGAHRQNSALLTSLE